MEILSSLIVIESVYLDYMFEFVMVVTFLPVLHFLYLTSPLILPLFSNSLYFY